MFATAPVFWWKARDARAALLSPLSTLYGVVADRRMANAPRVPVGLPVLCVGNFTVGGTGKTPVALALVAAAKARRLNPGVISRGHGGRAGPARLVDPARDSYADVGDEPLMMARHAPVAVGGDRPASAALLRARSCNFLIMDDGFQSAQIGIDLALVLVDATRGVGNGLVLPAGPLRATLSRQIEFADVVAVVGNAPAPPSITALAESTGVPLRCVVLEPRNDGTWSGERVLAFAGIGNPDRFFATLRDLGARVEGVRRFPDHHPYTADELAALTRDAHAAGLTLATTAKDAVRIGPQTAFARTARKAARR